MSPQDRAHRPDPSQGTPPSSSGGVTSQVQTGSLPDIRNGGTYFLGRYRVVDEIGIGGMASVHLARMDGPGGFQKWVAIKKIHPHLVEDESFVQMFLDEARVAARISHPNVATVFDLGKHEDTYWIAMEYLHGEPLREVMRRTEELGTAMPPEIACRVIADAAEGLHAAHELLGKNGEKLGLVHRDVTPHNLFVTYDGVTKVVDFGIAKFSSRMSHTRAGTLKGKLAYMSPEQVHGEGIDRRTDIFALGVVLWELTTGQRLFRMESDLDTLAKVQECNVPRPSTLIRGYPVDLEKIVMKALAKNRGERFRTARELSRALQSLLMRRGLFIASDEVAAYTQSIFSDRIQKREAHLRWAAEVTQTINVDQLLSKPKIGPEFTNSEVQPAGPVGKPVPPPLGAPPPRPLPAAGMPVAGQMSPPGPQVLPADAKETAASLTTPRAPLGGPPKLGRAPAPPRPAAGAPVTMPPPGFDEPHPADGDGPTIQGGPMMEAAYAERAALTEPPTLMEIGKEDPRRGNQNLSRSGQTLAPDEFEEEEQDQDETIVANTRDQNQQGGAFPQPPAPGPAGRNPNAPMPPGPAPTPPRPPPQRFASTAAVSNPQPAPQPAYGAQPSYTGEVPFAEPMPHSSNGNAPFGRQYPPHQHDPNDYGQQQRPMHHGGDVGGFPRQIPPSGQSGEFILPQGPGHRMQPTVPRVTHDNRTMTAQRFKRRPPMWVVAALSCSIALLIAGVVIAIISTTSTAPASARPNGSGTTVPTGATAPAAQGPFTAARTAFNTVVTAPPGPPPTAIVAPPPPGQTAPAHAPDPNAAITAPPVAPLAPPPAPNTATATRPDAGPAPAPAPQAPPATASAKKPVPAAAVGALTVVCTPKCDQIIDNGTPLGPGHIFNRPVPPGRHLLALSAPNGVKKTMTVEVAPELTREVRISMEK